MLVILEFVMQHLKKNKNARKINVIVFFIIVVLLLNYAGVNAIRDVMTRSAKEVVTGDLLACNADYDFSLIDSDKKKPEYVEDTEETISQLKRSQYVENVLERINSSAIMAVNEYTFEYIHLIGIDSAAESFDILEGASLKEENEILINRSVSDEYELKPGDEVVLNVSDAVSSEANLRCTIAGIYDNDRFAFMRSSHILMELEDLRRILGRPDQATHLMIYVRENTEEKALDELQKQNPSLKFLSSRESGELIYSIQDGMQYVMLSLVFVMMVIAMVIVTNLSLAYLKQQEKEIAVMRAMGMSKGQIISIYLLESFVQSLLLALLAVAFCMICVIIAAKIGIPIGGGQKLFGDNQLILSLKPWQITVSCGAIIFCSVFASFCSLTITLKRVTVSILQ